MPSSNGTQRGKIQPGTNLTAGMALLAWLSVLALPAIAQTTRPADHADHAKHAAAAASGGNQILVRELAELRAKAAKLQAMLEQNHQAPAGDSSPAMKKDDAGSMQGMDGMSKGKKMKKMGMKKKMPGKMGPMSQMKAMGSMGQKQDDASKAMDGMKMMGMRRPMGDAPVMMPKSAMPGFPGTSHLYHIGATGFFLDHAEHLHLTQAQHKVLNQIRQRVMADKTSVEQQVAQVQQELWSLTGSDTPDARKIEAKVRRIEKLNGDRRLAFIRAVGEAATVLTDPQRKTLAGQSSHTTTMPTTAPAESSPSMSH